MQTIEEIIAAARLHVGMAAEDWLEQRVSFAFGMLPHDSKLTKDDVRELIRKDFGKYEA